MSDLKRVQPCDWLIVRPCLLIWLLLGVLIVEQFIFSITRFHNLKLKQFKSLYFGRLVELDKIDSVAKNNFEKPQIPPSTRQIIIDSFYGYEIETLDFRTLFDIFYYFFLCAFLLIFFLARTKQTIQQQYNLLNVPSLFHPDNTNSGNMLHEIYVCKTSLKQQLWLLMVQKQTNKWPMVSLLINIFDCVNSMDVF